MRASAFLSSTALLLAIHGNAIAANRCNAFVSNMTGGELYVARDNCNSFKCLQQVVSNLFSEYSSINLKSNTNYSFYYKTTETMVTNSVVAVQIKHLGVEKHADAKPVGVKLQ
jgi:hypothetical protein